MAVCILSIETSTKVCSVALSSDEELVYRKEEYNGPSHAVLLGQFVQDAVRYARDNRLKPDAVAVSAGPGSYTGLRIGVSEAKGLCFGWNIPLIAVPTLQVIAAQAVGDGYDADYYCPMIDARRMEVYAAVYNRHLEEIRPVSADIVTADSYLDFLSKGKVLFFGDGAAKCSEVISSKNATFVENIHPLAANMASMALESYKNKNYQDVAYFEPFYLKEFQATTPKNKI